MKTLSIRIRGKVQGVFFRQSSKEKAGELGVTGNVKNLPNGSVEATVTGNEEQIRQFISWCHQGPSSARVTGIEIEELDLQSFDGFKIERHL